MSNLQNKIELVNLPKFFDNRGNLSFIQNGAQLYFDMRRVYWIYDVPGGEIRGGHAFHRQHEMIIALSGSFDVVTNDGGTEQRVTLNRSYVGLYVPNMIWRHMENFSTNSLALVLASTEFEESDYIRNYEDYLKAINFQRNER